MDSDTAQDVWRPALYGGRLVDPVGVFGAPSGLMSMKVHSRR